MALVRMPYRSPQKRDLCTLRSAHLMALAGSCLAELHQSRDQSIVWPIVCLLDEEFLLRQQFPQKQVFLPPPAPTSSGYDLKYEVCKLSPGSLRGEQISTEPLDMPVAGYCRRRGLTMTGPTIISASGSNKDWWQLGQALAVISVVSIWIKLSVSSYKANCILPKRLALDRCSCLF